MGGLLHLVQRRGAWAGPPPRCTKCNSPPTNGQCTKFVLFDVALQLPLESKGLMEKDWWHDWKCMFIYSVQFRGPVCPSFCTCAPKCKKLRFRSQIDGFLWTNCYAQSVAYRAIAHVHNVQYTVVSWGPRTGGHGVTDIDSDHAECSDYDGAVWWIVRWHQWDVR